MIARQEKYLAAEVEAIHNGISLVPGPIPLVISAGYYILDVSTGGFGLDYSTHEPITNKSK